MVSGVYFRMLCFGRNRRESPSLSLVNGKQVLTDSHLIYLVVMRKDNNRAELRQKAPIYTEIAPTWAIIR